MKPATRLRPRDLRLLRPEAIQAVSLLASGGTVSAVARTLGVDQEVLVRLIDCARFFHRASRLDDLRALPDTSPAGIARHLEAEQRWPKKSTVRRFTVVPA